MLRHEVSERQEPSCYHEGRAAGMRRSVSGGAVAAVASASSALFTASAKLALHASHLVSSTICARSCHDVTRALVVAHRPPARPEENEASKQAIYI